MAAVGNSVAFQVSITTTGTPQQLPNNPLQNGGTFTTKAGNTASIGLNPSSSASSSNSYELASTATAGSSVPFTGNNTNQLYIVGTEGDVLYFLGN